MVRHLCHSVQSLLLAILIAGCGQVEIPDASSMDVRQPVGNVALQADDPCVLVLIPSLVSALGPLGSIEKTILRSQRAVLHSTNPVPRLERLGWAYVAKARETRDAGFYKLAQQTAACIDSKAPDAPEAMLLQGHVLHNLHQFREAESLARRLVAKRGLWFDLALLGDVLMERGVLNEAIDAYQTVLDQRPGPQSYARVAQLRWLKGDLDGALEMMATALRATSPRVPELAAWTRVRLALLLMQTNELSAADTVLAQALVLQPDYPPALHALGRLLLAQDKALEAIASLERAVQKDPLPEFRWTLHEALLEAGQRDRANEQEATLLQRGAMEDRRTLSLFLANHGAKPNTALKLALQELKVREDVFTLDAVAWALAGSGRHEEAVEFSRKALAEGTQDARLFLHAGVIAAQSGDSSRALKLLTDAVLIQHMLLPSERQRLANEFAALQPRISTLEND